MTEAGLRDLKLVGTTSAAGGRYRRVRVTGEAALAGDTECRSLHCMGNFDVQGNLQADSIRLTGIGKVTGSLRVSRVKAIGELETTGARVDRLQLTGALRVLGNCEAEHLEMKGAIDVDGLLNAEQVSVKLYGPSRVREIGGGSVTVKRSRTLRLLHMFGQQPHSELTADLIEGDTLHLEHTRAAVVRGNRVILGPGCDIRRVEYRQELQAGKHAVIGESVKL